MRTAQHGAEGGGSGTMKDVIACLVIAMAVICSCKDSVTQSLLPKSGGQPYEVLLVSSDDESRAIIDSVLTQAAVGLPQAEPLFDVSQTDHAHFNQTARLARNIVILSEDSLQFTTTSIRYEKNAWARPQMVVYINTPSIELLRKAMNKQGHQLTDLLMRMEFNNEIENLNAGSNKKASEEVMEMFGWDIKIPTDMKSCKRGRNFLWYSNNTGSGMRNICIYTYDGNRLVPERALQERDSVMKENIPGEFPNMYMSTVVESVSTRIVKEKDQTIMISRGLWEMENDAMGGPFVIHSTVDTLSHKIIVAEAFVYAPEMKKRNLIRRAEAALYTLNKTNSEK
ncbi:MAG: DUF4837 family protein [Prevotella sp.]|nr:DUF4837 family protein [Prevotella sp.]